MNSQLLERFAQRAPVAVMCRCLFARLFSDQALDALFVNHAVRQVESDVLFSYLVNLVSPVVVGARKSVNASYQMSDSDSSRQAVYDKLKGVEAPVSTALVRSTVDELRSIQVKSKFCQDDVVPGYHTYVIDGKTYNGTQHRLKESRTDSRCPLPGRAIAILDTRYELFVDVECDANAHRCERKIFEPMLERLEAGALYLADRNFSDSIILSGFIKANAFFVVRQHGASPSWRETKQKSKRLRRRASKGGVVSEQEIEVKLPDGSWKRIRRVTVKLKQATRNGDKHLHLLTNLPASVSATTIANSYRQRWTIETCLGYLAQALNAEINTLVYPKAAGLCFCLALVMFNMMSTVKAQLRRHAKQKKSDIEVSYYYMSHEIAEAHTGLQIAIDETHWQRYAKMTTSEFAAFLKTVASNAILERYRKHRRGPKKKPPRRKFTGARHVATQKLLDGR